MTSSSLSPRHHLSDHLLLVIHEKDPDKAAAKITSSLSSVLPWKF
jgi:hypothetical protein